MFRSESRIGYPKHYGTLHSPADGSAQLTATVDVIAQVTATVDVIAQVTATLSSPVYVIAQVTATVDVQSAVRVSALAEVGALRSAPVVGRLTLRGSAP